MVPILPVTFELAAETTFPVNEEHSTGLLMLSGQIMGIIDTFAMDALINDHDWSSDTSLLKLVFRPVSVYMALCVLITFLLGMYATFASSCFAPIEYLPFTIFVV